MKKKKKKHSQNYVTAPYGCISCVCKFFSMNLASLLLPLFYIFFILYSYDRDIYSRVDLIVIYMFAEEMLAKGSLEFF